MGTGERPPPPPFQRRDEEKSPLARLFPGGGAEHSTLAFEIHDAGILGVDESGTVSEASPGYALWDGGTIVAGQAAFSRARKTPRWIHNRFWQELDTTPLGRPFPHELSSADLAHAHLSAIWKMAPSYVDRVLLAIPGCFSTRQLGLILGIARACGMPVAGLVDTAAAAAPVATIAGHPGARLLHLDIHLHRLVITELELSAPPRDSRKSLTRIPAGESWATVIKRRVRVGDDEGLVALQHTWVRRVAELFVQTTRYDPQHSADAEQALYSRLPEWLEMLRSEELIEASLGPPGKEHAIELTRPDLVAAAEPFYDRFLELVLGLKRAGESVTLLLARGVAELPGLEPRLAELRGVLTVPLPAGAAAAGALLTSRQIHNATEAGSDPSPRRGANGTSPRRGANEKLPFVTRLSFAAPPPAAEAPWRPSATSPSKDPAPCPTHLVHNGLAYAITEQPFRLGAPGGEPGLELEGPAAGNSRSHCSVYRHGTTVIVDDHSICGIFVNGRRVHRQATLEVGDRLRLGTLRNPASGFPGDEQARATRGVELELIAVVEMRRPRPSGIRPGAPPGRRSGAPPGRRSDGTP